jgi:hypothetical protein
LAAGVLTTTGGLGFRLDRLLCFGFNAGTDRVATPNENRFCIRRSQDNCFDVLAELRFVA